MHNINRLLMKAKNSKYGKKMHILGFIDYRPEKQKYTASGTIWDGKAGSGGESFYSEHETQNEAVSACEAIAAQYPNSENINFIMDDLSSQPEVTTQAEMR